MNFFIEPSLIYDTIATLEKAGRKDLAKSWLIKYLLMVNSSLPLHKTAWQNRKKLLDCAVRRE